MSYVDELNNLYTEAIVPQTNLKIPAVVPPPPALSAQPVANKPSFSQQNETKAGRTINMNHIDTPRKANHAAYILVDSIYQCCKNDELADHIINTMRRIHRKERA